MKNQSGYFVIENTQGKVIRVLNWQDASLHLVFRNDTKRVEAVGDTKRLESEGVSFRSLAVATQEQVRKKAVEIDGFGRLVWVDRIEDVTPEVALPPEENQFNGLMKWSAIGHVAVVVLILMTYQVAQWLFDEEEPIVVEVVRQLEKEPPRQVVAPSEKKLRNVPKKVATVKPKKPQNRALKTASKAQKYSPARTRSKSKQVAQKKGQAPSIHQVGALGVLGSPGKGKGGGEKVNLNSLRSGSVAGIGKGAGSGVGRSAVGQGLAASAKGSGYGKSSGAIGGQGYRTRGKGGGGQSGYGKHTLAGSSSAFSQPLASEAFVEGGLERDQILAVLQRARGQATYCYEKGLQTDPGLRGRIELAFIIGGRGRVTSSRIGHSSMGSSKVERCLQNVVRGLKFPQPKGGVDVSVSFPFMFDRANQG